MELCLSTTDRNYWNSCRTGVSTGEEGLISVCAGKVGAGKVDARYT
jgi:hypothetical protein